MAISYSAVVLDEPSKNKLITELKDKIPLGWEVVAHHMTIKMGELPADKKSEVGKDISLTAKEIGQSDKALAVKVTGYATDNKLAHITIAVNRAGGGKPFDSNKITEWTPLINDIILKGKVEEVPFKSVAAFIKAVAEKLSTFEGE